MTRQKAIAIVVPLVLALAYVSLWHRWNMGSVMAGSEQPNTSFPSRIIVRKIPSPTPFWAVLLIPFLIEDARYRCELYAHGSEEIISAQTYYYPPSEHAGNAWVGWEQSGAATVYLDNAAVLTLDKEGQWRKVK